jgi:hypothetical protein
MDGRMDEWNGRNGWMDVITIGDAFAISIKQTDY